MAEIETRSLNMEEYVFTACNLLGGEFMVGIVSVKGKHYKTESESGIGRKRRILSVFGRCLRWWVGGGAPVFLINKRSSGGEKGIDPSV